MNDNIPTVKEFGIVLAEYHDRIIKRMNRLGGLFLGLVGVIFIDLIISMLVSKIFLSLIPIAVTGIAFIGFYIVITYFRWHKANGVFCKDCGKNLISLSDQYDIDPDEGEALPTELHCPKCKKLIARTLKDSPSGNPAPQDT
jgi:uncharacterized membrane protein YuzA (DUF378 family)